MEKRLDSSTLMDTYARQPIAFSHGKGCWLYDTEGRTYLDALAGIAVNTLGHAHPRLVSAIEKQAGELLHTSNLYQVPQQISLAETLVRLSELESVFFCNSGCEANEAAIKLARLYGHKKGIEQPTIIVMERAFHGRTMATLSATGNRRVQAGFEPLVGGFVRVPYNDIQAISAVAERSKNVVAVMLEVVQGEGGIHMASAEFLQSLRQLCDEQQWLLICDEVQCGIGRTGHWFGFQALQVQPDVVTLAKGLGSGVPIGACIAGGQAAGVFSPGDHGSTFGGNPLACIAASTTIQVIEDEKLLAHAHLLGNRICEQFRQILHENPGVVDIRGAGLMIGIELNRPCAQLVSQALEAGVLINVTADTVLRLLPPLVMSEQEADEMVTRVGALILKFLEQAQ